MIDTGASVGRDKADRQDWLILSDSMIPPTFNGDDALMEAGLFVTEFTLPLVAPTLLLEIRSDDGWPRTFALFYEPTVGIVLLHRQGRAVARHILPGSLPDLKGQARLSYRFDAPARRWDLRFEILGQAEDDPLNSVQLALARGGDPIPLRLGDLSALASGTAGAHRDPAILWFGLSQGRALPSQLPWIGQRTPVETSLGPRMAGQLQPGDLVQDMDGEFVPLRGLRHVDLPSRGSFAPVFLRAPFFGARHDLLVAADQQIALTGPEVEYLFGQENVGIKAVDLVDGQTAILDQRRAMTRAVALDFGKTVLAMADGCALLCQPNIATAAEPSLHCLHRYEAITLMTLWGRAAQGRRTSVRIP